jgi:hypothetical protein
MGNICCCSNKKKLREEEMSLLSYTDDELADKLELGTINKRYNLDIGF